MPEESGGHTVFPLLGLEPAALAAALPVVPMTRKAGQGSEIHDLALALCSRCRSGSAEPGCVLPRRGDVLMFYSRQPNGAPDPTAWNMECPLVASSGKGKRKAPVKWTAQKKKVILPEFWGVLGKSDEHWSAPPPGGGVGMPPLTMVSPLTSRYDQIVAGNPNYDWKKMEHQWNVPSVEPSVGVRRKRKRKKSEP